MYLGVSKAEAADRFTTRIDDLMPGSREAVCTECNLVMPLAGFNHALFQCADCAETRCE